jgi:hypothetical protein
MKLSIACKAAIQALTMLGISRLVKAQTCTDDASFVCGYIVDGIEVVDGSYSVCVEQTDKKGVKRKSECMKKADYPAGLAIGTVTDRKKGKVVISCGCCAEEKKPPDYCDYKPLPCNKSLFSSSCKDKKVKKKGKKKGKKQGKEEVEVRVCYTDKMGKPKEKCLAPFENLDEDDTFIGCGEFCTPPSDVPYEASVPSATFFDLAYNGKADELGTGDVLGGQSWLV